MSNKVNKSLIVKRIKEHYNYKTDTDFAKFLDIPVTTLSSWYKRSTYDLDILYEKCLELNPDWLITGNGTMLRATNEQLATVNVITKPDLRNPHRPTKELVQFYDVDFAAGSITFFDDVNSQTPSYTMDIPDFNGCIAFRAYGDSMYPTVYSGSILFAKRNEQWADGLEYGQMYGIVLHDGTRYLKYIRKSKTEKRFLLKSENKKYDDFEIDKSRIKSIWAINGWLNKNA